MYISAPLMRQNYTPHEPRIKAHRISYYKIFHCSNRVTHDVARWLLFLSLGQLLIFRQVLNCFWLRTVSPVSASSLPCIEREQLNISPSNDKAATSPNLFWGHSPLVLQYSYISICRYTKKTFFNI